MDLCTLVIPKREALRNAVDVVERLRDPNRKPSRDPITIHPDLALNGWHLRVQHTYNSMTISAFLIQQEGAERWMRSPASRRRGGGGGVIPVGLRLITNEIYLVEELENRELARVRVFWGSIPLVFIGGRGRSKLP